LSDKTTAEVVLKTLDRETKIGAKILAEIKNQCKMKLVHPVLRHKKTRQRLGEIFFYF